MGETKLSNVQDKGAITITESSTSGQDIIREELHSLNEDFDTWLRSVGETTSQLGTLMLSSILI